MTFDSPHAASLTIGLVGGMLLACLYLGVKYSRIIGRIFEERPPFHPVRGMPLPGGEEVRFPSADGLELAGTYYATEEPHRLGVIVFCHEFLGSRHSVQHYAASLRDLGFDLFTFDFRNHGESPPEPGVEPIQWVSDRDKRDLNAALAYLGSRPDRDPAGVALFGVSRGGGAALCVAAESPEVWGIVTDGAFPTRGTMLAYSLRWAEIYVRTPWIRRLLPMWVYHYVGWAARLRSERRLRRRFPDVERAASAISPRPWLAIHGARDAYIGPEIATDLFRRAGEPKEFWLVPKAKHNRSREVAPEAYHRKLAGFFHRYAPRRCSEALPATAVEPPEETSQTNPIRSRRKAPARLTS